MVYHISMKLKGTLFALLMLPLFGLSSCGKMEYGYHDDKLPTIDRNGDLLALKDASKLTYNDVTIEGSIDAYRKDVAANQDFFLLFTRETCSHCISLEPAFVSFALDSGLKIYRDSLADHTSMVEWAEGYEQGDMSSIKEHIETPVVFLVKANNGKPEAIYKDFYQSTGSGNELSTYFSKQLNRTNIYHFETIGGVEAFHSAHQEALYYFNSGSSDSFYRENIYDLAKKSKKPLACIEVNSFTDRDKERLASMFPTSYSEDFLYLDGGEPNARSFRAEPIEAKKIVAAYYK